MRSLLIILLSLICTIGRAQPLCHIDHYSELNDKANHVGRILQDKQGFIWLATSNGLLRFDGYNFITFKPTDDIPNFNTDNSRTAYMAADGNIWCNVDKKALLFNTRTCTFSDALASFEESSHRTFDVKKIRTTPGGDAWITTADGLLLHASAAGTSIERKVGDASDAELRIDRLGRTCVLTPHGAFIFGKTVKRITHAFTDLVNAGGTSWLIDAQRRVFRLTQDDKTAELKDPRLSGHTDALTAEGQMILAETDHGILFLNPLTGQVADLGISGQRETSFCDAAGNVWLQTKDGRLLRVSAAATMAQTILGINSKIKKIIDCGEGYVGMLTDDGQLYCVAPGSTLGTLCPNDGSDLSNSNTFAVDKQGGLWFVTTAGLNRVWFKQRFYDVFDLGFEAKVRTLYSDSKGRLWVMTKEPHTICLFDQHNRRLGFLGPDGTIHSEPTTVPNPVYAMTEDAQGHLWLGCKPGGLFRLTERSAVSFAVEQFLPDKADRYSINSEAVYDLQTDHQGRLWIGTFTGGVVCVPDPSATKPRFIHRGNLLRGYTSDFSEFATCLLITRDQHLIVGTNHGLLTASIKQRDLSKLKFTSITRDADRPDGLSSNSVISLAEAPDGIICIGTENAGLNVVTPAGLYGPEPRFRHYNQQNSLVGDIVRSVFFADGKAWLVSMGHLEECIAQHDQADTLFNVFFRNEGITFTEARPVRLPDGRWLFGTAQGCIATNLSKLNIKKPAYTVELTSVVVGNTQMAYGREYGDTIVLQPGERQLTVNFSSLDYDAPAEVGYAYKIGDGQWNYIGKNHSVNFSHLGVGTFKLIIRSTDADGVWMDNYKSVTIIVKPHFWKTVWGWIVIILCGGLLIYCSIRLWLYVKAVRRSRDEAHTHLEQIQTTYNKKEEMRRQHQELLRKAAEEAQNDEFMRQVQEFVQANLYNSYTTIDTMAEALAMSRSALTRRTRQALGVSPNELLRQARIERACELLKDKEATVTTVAYRCGFSDPKYFSRTFKSVMGITPTEYQADHAAE